MTFIENMVSVIIPTYNHANLIDETVSSVLNQTYKDIEVLICDDGSTDGSIEKIRQWSINDSRVVPLLSSKNEGLSMNINKGLDRARGEYVAFLGGDDKMKPEKIEKQVDFLKNHSDYDVVLHWIDVFDSNTGKTLHTIDSFILESPTDWFLAARSFGFFKKKWNSTFPHIAYLARSSYVLQSRWDFRLRYKNEILFTIDNYMKKPQAKWHCIPEVLGLYRMHENNMHKSKEMNEALMEETYVNYIIASARYPELQAKLKRVLVHFLYDRLYYYLVTDGKRQIEEVKNSKTRLRSEAGFWLYWYAMVYLKIKSTYWKRKNIAHKNRILR